VKDRPRHPPTDSRSDGSARSSDLAERIAAQAAIVDRGGVWWLLRAALCAVAVGYLLLAVPALLFEDNLHHGHLAAHLGAFGVAYGVALMFVALRPATARALVPFTIALAAAMILLAVIDVARGRAPALGEFQHLLELAGLVLVWLLATRRSWATPAATAAAPPRHLRVVRPGEEPEHPASGAEDRTAEPDVPEVRRRSPRSA
jgi:hypothetical protein